MIGVKGIRALWGYLYGCNPSGSPRRISTLIECINNKNKQSVEGWVINNDLTRYKACLIHKPKCIKILTNNVGELLLLLNTVHLEDTNIWRVSYKHLDL